MQELESAHMALETLDAGWTVGRFAAFDRLEAIEHVVTTRDSLDVHKAREQPRTAARELAATCGWRGVAYARQSHGRQVVYATGPGLVGEVDGLVTDRPGLGVMAFGADCPLILVADPVRRAVGVAHASWRGTVYRITETLVACMCGRFASRPDELVAAISPSAGPCCYEVGEDLIDRARLGLGRSVDKYLVESGGKTCFDLWQANVDQLRRIGLVNDHIHPAGVCTICGPDLFPSYRRERDQAGRFLAAIAVQQ
jgi:YfiH family protein